MSERELEKMVESFPEFMKFLEEELGGKITVRRPKVFRGNKWKKLSMRSYPVSFRKKIIGSLNEIYSNDGKKIVSVCASYDSKLLAAYVGGENMNRKDE